jgi:hypothetical protein
MSYAPNSRGGRSRFGSICGSRPPSRRSRSRCSSPPICCSPQSIAQKDREIIRAQLDLCRSWYEDGGLTGLSQRFAEHSDSGREAFFVRIAGPDRAGIFISQPAGSEPLDPATLDALGTTPRRNGRGCRPACAAGRGLSPPRNSATGTGCKWARPPRPTAHCSNISGSCPRGCSDSASRSACSPAHSSPAARCGPDPPPDRRRASRPRHRPHGCARARWRRTGRRTVRTDLPVQRDARKKRRAPPRHARGARQRGPRSPHSAHPLASTAERTLAAPPGPADREAVSDALEETERVLLLLDTLMDISEAETGLMRLDKTEVLAGAAAAEATALYEMVAEDRGIAVQNEVPADARDFRRSAAPPPGARQPARQRPQIHPARRHRHHLFREPTRRQSCSACATPAPASRQKICRASGSASTAATRAARRAASASASRSSKPSPTPTAARPKSKTSRLRRRLPPHPAGALIFSVGLRKVGAC